MGQDALYTYLPETGDLTSNLLVAALLAVMGLAGCAILAWRPGRGQARNYRLLGAMLLFFLFLIAASVSFFSWLTLQRTGPVYLFADAVQTPRGTIPFDRIRNARILTAGNRSFIDPQRVRGGQQLLVIEELDGTTHVLAEEFYPVQEILSQLRQTVRAWEEDK